MECQGVEQLVDGCGDLSRASQEVRVGPGICKALGSILGTGKKNVTVKLFLGNRLLSAAPIHLWQWSSNDAILPTASGTQQGMPCWPDIQEGRWKPAEGLSRLYPRREAAETQTRIADNKILQVCL